MESKEQLKTFFYNQLISRTWQLKVEEKVKRGRPKNLWERVVAKDLKTYELGEEQAQDRISFESTMSGKRARI